jgi:YMGG-like Gly-zipper
MGPVVSAIAAYRIRRKIHDFPREMPNLPAIWMYWLSASRFEALHHWGVAEMLVARNLVQRSVVGIIAISFSVGCSNMNNSQKGAVVGGAGGAALGAIVGKQLGNTGAGAAVGALSGLAAGGLIGNAEDATEQRENAQRQAAYEQNLRVRQARAVTNSDIVSMAQNGVDESTICNEIRTHGGNFDTSPQAIIYLQRAGVSNTVVQAMQNCRGY